MLEGLLGSLNQERILIFLYCREEGYAREIARFFDAPLDPIQKLLKKMEFGGILVGRTKGRTRLFMLNPRYPFFNELKSLLERALTFFPESEKSRLTMARTRPRRVEKPL
jgi:hypothetical protein